MSLKNSIVIVNEFTNKSGMSKGSRGSSPGAYVKRYMSREDAVEKLSPVRNKRIDAYINRYMAREDAAEKIDAVDDSIGRRVIGNKIQNVNMQKNIENKLDDTFEKVDNHAGVAFGFGDVSLSSEKLLEHSKAIQSAYDNGKTVMKTVISFDEEYLRQNHLVPEHFRCENKGDYRGRLDQLKLRRSIMSGIDRLGRDFDDLQYIGVIQVDTKHVHCHLAMVDLGEGTLASDGTQRGKLSDTMKSKIRRGIDSSLDNSKSIAYLSSNVNYDKRNLKCYVKKYSYYAVRENSFSQFLLATLPEDESKWRAGSKSKDMRKANIITAEFVGELFKQHDSGYNEAMKDVIKYADERQKREGLTQKEHKKLINNGHNMLLEKCMNSVYDTLREIPKEDRCVITPTLDIMSMDLESLASQRKEASDDIFDFGYKLRSYASRLDHHKKEKRKYEDLYDNFKDTSPDSPSFALVDFYRCEAEYNEKCMVKYKHFLHFADDEEEYEKEYNDLMRYRQRRDNFKRMMDDKDMPRMKPQNAEEYGRRLYNTYGGRYTVLDKGVLEYRLSIMDNIYDEKKEILQRKLTEQGLNFVDGKVEKGFKYSFDEVKALDLHHLSYDFTDDVLVSKVNVDKFLDVAEERINSYKKACVYLQSTNQSEFISQLPSQDIIAMKETAQLFDGRRVLKSSVKNVAAYKRSKTHRLDVPYKQKLSTAIKNSINSARLEFE